MRAGRRLVALSVNILLLIATSRARAQAGSPEAPSLEPPPLAPAPLRIDDGPPAWQRWALGLSVGAAAVGLVVGVGAMVVRSQKVREFNDYRAPSAVGPETVCRVGAPDSGPPGCAQLLDDANSARRLSYVGFAAAGTFAVAAVVLALLPSGSDRLSFRPGQMDLALVRF
jgi:hypothetical protein